MALYSLSGTVILGNGRYIKNGCVVFDSDVGIILDVGDREKILKDYKPEFEMGCEDCIVMPGLVNTHTHLAMTLMRGFPGTISGFSWLSKIWELERKLEPWHIYAGALLGMVNAVKSGITTVSDHYYYAEETFRAAKEVGIRAFLARTYMDQKEGPKGHESAESSIKFAESYRNKSELITTMIGPHAAYTCSKESLRESAEVSISTGIRLHMHLSESRDEVSYIEKTYGLRPIKYAEALGLIKNEPLFAHLTYASSEEVALLALNRAKAAYCPFTKMRGGQEISPVKEMLSFGMRVGLATDGPASVYSLDMFREMRFLLAAQNHKYSSPNTISPEIALRTATLGGAEALGIEKRVGSIDAGKEADLIILKPEKAKIWPFTNPYQAIVYSVTPEDVLSVFVKGRPIVVERRVITVNEDKVIELAQKAREDLITDGILA